MEKYLIKEKKIENTDKKAIDVEEIMGRLREISEKAHGKKREDKQDIERVYNSFSGTYWSPTFLKSFQECPAKCFLYKFVPKSKIANIGSCIHKIFELIIKEGSQKWENVTKEKIVNILKDSLKEFSIEAPEDIGIIKSYIRDFLNAKDYLDESKPFPYSKICNSMYPEAFYSENISFHGVDAGLLFTLIDRVDIRGDEIYIIDYKSGDKRCFNEEELKTKYLNQFIAYKLMVEQTFGIEVSGCYIYSTSKPGWIKVENVDSLKHQSMLIELVHDHMEDINNQISNNIFEKRPGYICRYCCFKKECKNGDPIEISFEYEEKSQ